MIYLPLAKGALVILFFAIKIGVFFGLVKIFNKGISFPKVLKRLLIFELGAFLFYLAYLYITRVGLLIIVGQFIVMFAWFAFLTTRKKFLTLKKAIIIFLLIFIVITPLISFGHDIAMSRMVRISVIEQEMEELTKDISIQSVLWFGPKVLDLPLSLKIVGRIEVSLLEKRFIGDISNYLFVKHYSE